MFLEKMHWGIYMLDRVSKTFIIIIIGLLCFVGVFPFAEEKQPGIIPACVSSHIYGLPLVDRCEMGGRWTM